MTICKFTFLLCSELLKDMEVNKGRSKIIKSASLVPERHKRLTFNISGSELQSRCRACLMRSITIVRNMTVKQKSSPEFDYFRLRKL